MLGYFIGAAAALAGVATFAGFHAMLPKSQLYGRTFIGVDEGSRLLALTYDDGPNVRHTEALLEVLAKHGAKATFFMLGRNVRELPLIARRVAEAGHDIGNHTFTHANLALTSRDQIVAQIETCEQILSDAVGPHSNLFRPPFGGRRPLALAIARRKQLVPVMWRISAEDWNEDPADVVVDKVARQIRGGEVILMHDGGHLGPGADRSQTVIATDRLIARYAAEGYRFVSVTEIMRAAEQSSKRAHI